MLSNIANSAVVFADPLDGALGSDLQITGGSGTIAFDAANDTLLAGAAGGGNGGRVYVGTAATDFITVTNIGFVAEVTVTINPGDNNADTAFFGVGEGIDPGDNGGGPSFDEPSGGTAVAYFGVRDAGNTIINDNLLGDNGPDNNDISVGDGTHRFRLTFAGGDLVLSAQVNEMGEFIDQATIDVSDNGFNATNSRIFFGGSNEATFDDFEVVSVTTIPEPTSAALLSLGGGLLLLRRRR